MIGGDEALSARHLFAQSGTLDHACDDATKFGTAVIFAHAIGGLARGPTEKPQRRIGCHMGGPGGRNLGFDKSAVDGFGGVVGIVWRYFLATVSAVVLIRLFRSGQWAEQP